MLKKLMLSFICVTACLCTLSAQAHRDLITPSPIVQISNGQEIILRQSGQTIYTRVAITPPSINPRVRAPLNLALVIDTSGSMDIGDRIANAKKAAINLIEMLSENDTLSLVVFSSDARVLVPAQRLTDKKIFLNAISRIHPNGNTALYAGVELGSKQLAEFRVDHSVNRVILLSDGEANVGPSSAHALSTFGAELARQNIAVTTIGLGLGYNATLMERLAAASDGNHIFVQNARDLETTFQREFHDAASIVARNAHIQIEFSSGITPVRIYGYEGTISGQNVIVNIPQLSGGQEKYIIVESVIHHTPETNHIPVANVSASYTHLDTGETISQNASSSVQISADETTVQSSYNTSVMENVVQQRAIAGNAIALQAIEAGDMKLAETVLHDTKIQAEAEAQRYNVPQAAAVMLEQITEYEEQMQQGDIDVLSRQLNQDVYNMSRQKPF